MIRLVLADMDGTLVPLGANGVSERTMRAIAALREAGIAFAPATGRSPGDVLRFFGDDVSVLRDALVASGRIVYAHGAMVQRSPLGRELLSRVVEAVSQLGAGVGLCDDAVVRGGRGVRWLMAPPGPFLDRELSLGVAFPGLRLVEEIPDWEFFVTGVAFDPREVDTELVRRTVEDACPDVSLTQSIPGWFDINLRGWTKANGLAPLESALGVENDEVAFIGDSENDVALLRAVGHPLCVADGQDVAKAAAEGLVGAAADDGPAQLMEHLAQTGGVL